MDERVEANRLRWDEMADLHVHRYGIDEVDARMAHALKPFEPNELGSLTGMRVCHLQCHLGCNTFALVNLGAAEAVGVDFSPRSIEIARLRAERIGLADRVRFVCAAVEKAPVATGAPFDVVYTSWGVLCWLPDIGRWAQTVSALLTPGGFLYLAESHPYATALRWPGYTYGGAVPHFEDGPGDYTDDDAIFEHPESWEWSHGLGEIVTALATAGLRIDWVHEHPTAAWHLNDKDHLVERNDEMWESPGQSLPLSFSLRATKP